MKRTIFFGGLVLWALAAGAEARDWGFDKDTVYEWKAGGDTVLLVNGGSDTLRLDSVFAEEVDGSTIWGVASFLYDVPESDSPQHYTLNQFTHRSIKLTNNGIPPTRFVFLRLFDIATSAPTAKFSANLQMVGDTVMVRLRFKSTTTEEDTLIVRGTYDEVVSIQQSVPLESGLRNPGLPRDIRGRVFSPSWGSPTLK
jgi:hypothetical protein